MTDAELVVRKLAMMREHVSRARRRRPASVDALRVDVDVQDMLALGILVAVQEAIDIAFHIVADEGWGAPASYAESFELLAQRGVIDRALADALTRGVGLRNRLAHAYATLDVGRLWQELPDGLAALDRFAEASRVSCRRSRDARNHLAFLRPLSSASASVPPVPAPPPASAASTASTDSPASRARRKAARNAGRTASGMSWIASAAAHTTVSTMYIGSGVLGAGGRARPSRSSVVPAHAAISAASASFFGWTSVASRPS